MAARTSASTETVTRYRISRRWSPSDILPSGDLFLGGRNQLTDAVSPSAASVGTQRGSVPGLGFAGVERRLPGLQLGFFEACFAGL